VQPTAHKAVKASQYYTKERYILAIQIIREVTADVVKRGSTKAVYAKQYDINSRFLNVRIQDDGKDIVVDSNLTVILNAKRADKAEKMFYGSINADGTVKVPLDAWILELAGTAVCDISLVSSDPKVAKLTTMQFNVYVEEAVFSEGDVDDSEDYSVVVDLLTRIDDMEQRVEALERGGTSSSGSSVVIEESNPEVMELVGTELETQMSPEEAIEASRRGLSLKVMSPSSGEFYIFTLTTVYDYSLEESPLVELIFQRIANGMVTKLTISVVADSTMTVTDIQFEETLAEDTAPFVITVTGDDESGYTADKTGAEIKAAYSDNCRMVCNFGSINAIPLTSSNMLPNLLAQRFTFHTTNGTDYHTINILVYPNATITISVSSGTYSTGTSKPLTINGTTYNGSSAVTIDTTDFEVTVSGDPESGFSANKSFAEISNAYTTGRTVVCYLEMSGALCSLVTFPSVDAPMFGFCVTIGLMGSIMVSIASDNSVTVEEIYSMITIGEQSWMGDIVDFTDTINGMIDAKLGVIENGSY
jgi:hypothetical protein